MRALIAIFLIMALPTGASAADLWQVAGKWNLNLQPASCTMGRVFRSNSGQVSLGFTLLPPWKGVRLLVVAPPAIFRRAPADVSIKVPDLPAMKATMVPGGEMQDGSLLLTANLPGVLLASLLGAKELVLETGGTSLALPVGGSPAAISAVNKCATELLLGWKIDPTEADRLPPPYNGMWHLFGDPRDYPRDAMQKHQQGDVAVVWRIEADGTVRDCRVVESSGSAALDQKSCELVRQRARYKPTPGLSGAQPASWERMNFSWRLPG